MSLKVVEAAWVWRFTAAPFKATYGRLPGTTYSKDFLQASGACAAAFDDVFSREPAQRVALSFQWPGGSRRGELFEAADYADNGRLDLRWQTDDAPDPWRLYPLGSTDRLATIPGNPDHSTAQEADAEFEQLTQAGYRPWLVVVKLLDEPDRLHVRAYLESPPPSLEHADAAQLPLAVRDVMAAMPANKACGVVRFNPSIRAQGIVLDALDALSREPNVLLVGPPGTGKTVALEDLRHLFDGSAGAVLFDTERVHDAWLPAAKARTVVFHPSYSYEEFVLGLMPKSGAGGGIELEARPGPLLSLAHWASEPGNHSVLFADEFNRGNAAAIFGDTLSLLDAEKRHAPEAGETGAVVDRGYPGMSVQTPGEFATSAGTTVPEQLRFSPRLRIVAALNSSDRSVAPLDAAMRRRFSIIHVRPDLELVAERFGVAPHEPVPVTDPADWDAADVFVLAVALLRTLNERIELVLGGDFLLGHALLWGVNGPDRDLAARSLAATFDERIASTLRMTFVDQDEALAAILGVPPTGTSIAGPVIAEMVPPPPALAAVAGPRLRLHRAALLAPVDALRALRTIL